MPEATSWAWPIDDLNERIAAKLEELEIDDVDVAQRLEKELKRDYHIITAEKRLEQVARDFVAALFRQRGKPARPCWSASTRSPACRCTT